ncbi:ExbD/TolR family protein [Sphingomonas sp. ID0503]|uniref:ExbD/TolR family protein n=1 Tax=Sphingomonas sp. ID0503 TaxID=3399691 RepID=UPI003AFA33ED
MAMGGMPKRGGKGRAPMAEINVTPLVDVMLVLLIIFMVAAPLLTAGVEVKLPDSRAGALEQEQKPIQLTLDSNGGVFIDEERIANAELPQRLEVIRGRGGDKEGGPQIFLRADTTLDYGRVMRVMGELNRAGLNRVALVTTPDEGK